MDEQLQIELHEPCARCGLPLHMVGIWGYAGQLYTTMYSHARRKLKAPERKIANECEQKFGYPKPHGFYESRGYV